MDVRKLYQKTSLDSKRFITYCGATQWAVILRSKNSTAIAGKSLCINHYQLVTDICKFQTDFSKMYMILFVYICMYL